jgi:hypothetical protein
MIKKKNVAVFTVCNVAYLNKVMVLADSLFKTNQIKLDIFIFDSKRELNIPEICNIHWIEDLDIPDFKSLAFKYTIIEFSTALKPWLALNLLERNSKVIFFDPDVMVLNTVDTIFEELDEHPVILTPHYFNPKNNGLIDDTRLMRFGYLNLGFFAVNGTDESRAFLSWWSERCMSNSFDDAQFGIFTDQKWVSIAQCFYPFLSVSYNPGYNTAFWNLDERTISKNDEGEYLINNKYPLLFFHFSSFDFDNPEELSKKEFEIGENKMTLLSELGNSYAGKLNSLGSITSDTDYSFDYMSNGKYISPSLRRAYASIYQELPQDHDPFDSNGVVYRFARKNHLIQKNNTKFLVQGYNNVAEHGNKIRFAFALMRLLLRVIGPNSFMNFSRFLVYLSSYQRNPEMWKK